MDGLVEEQSILEKLDRKPRMKRTNP
jgi:hypothetical protein